MNRYEYYVHPNAVSNAGGLDTAISQIVSKANNDELRISFIEVVGQGGANMYVLAVFEPRT